MAETTDQIKSHIDAKRADLRSSISELEDKVHSVADWRRQFQRHPGAMVAVALGGGVLLSLLLRGKRTPPAAGSASVAGERSAGERSGQRVLETIDDAKSALVSVAAAKFTEILGDLVPGFRHQLSAVQAGKDHPPVH